MLLSDYFFNVSTASPEKYDLTQQSLLNGSVGSVRFFSRKLRFCCENGKLALLGQSVLL